MGKPFGGFDGYFVVVISGAKQGDEATRISNDHVLVNFLHRGIHRSARTNPPAPAPATPPLPSPSEVRRHLRSHGLRGAWKSAPCLPAPVSLPPQARLPSAMASASCGTRAGTIGGPTSSAKPPPSHACSFME